MKELNELSAIYSIPENLLHSLMIKESMWDMFALSNKNARGLFQFLPETAIEFGLVVNNKLDERTDPWKASDAAARYLTWIFTYLHPDIDRSNIDNYKYDFCDIVDNMVEKHKKKLLGFTRFSNLVKENENNLYTIMKYLWDDILCVHPTTKYIFLKDKSFDIQNQSTYKKLIDKFLYFSASLMKVELGCSFCNSSNADTTFE